MSLPMLSGVARLIDEPELRFTPGGKAVAKVRLAFNSRKKNPETNQWEDDKVCFLNGTAWGQEAEHVAESLQRGHEVVVTGRLETRKYETREGESRSSTDLLIDAIGPTLKFATAKVNKMSRSGSGGGTPSASGGFGDDPWASGQPATADSSRSSSGSEEPPF